MKVIFLHGLGQGPSSWNKTVAAMDGGVEAFCPDLFALAQGEAPDYAALYRGLSEICREQTGDGLHLCGLSLGAVLALQYGQEHPEQVKSLVLIGGRTRTPRTLMKIQRIFCYLFKRVINGIEEGRLWPGGFIGDGDARMTAEGHGKKTIESTVGITVDRLCINQLLCIPRIAEKIADRAFYRGRFFSVPIDTQDDVAKEFT